MLNSAHQMVPKEKQWPNIQISKASYIKPLHIFRENVFGGFLVAFHMCVCVIIMANTHKLHIHKSHI